MADAIISGAVNEYGVKVVARDEKLLSAKNVETILLDDGFDISGKIILLAIKPYALELVSPKLKGRAKAVISVLAGSSIDSIKKEIDSEFYVRAMPNLAATYQKSMTTLCGDEEFKNEAIKIAQSFGTALWLSSEKELDIATAVAGSGPAFLALIAESLADGGVKEGLKRDDAYTLVRGLFEGFSPLLNDKHPAIIKDEVMSPGGTTAAGYSALEEGGTRDSMIKAITKAYERAKG
jgi:pyrroline-5-carboxylate reductase